MKFPCVIFEVYDASNITYGCFNVVVAHGNFQVEDVFFQSQKPVSRKVSPCFARSQRFRQAAEFTVLAENPIDLHITEAYASCLAAWFAVLPWSRRQWANQVILAFEPCFLQVLVEVAPESKDEFEEIMNGTGFAAIGQVTDSEVLEVYGVDDRRILVASLTELKEAWQRPIRW